MNAPDSEVDELTVEGVTNDWLRVTTPDGDARYVAAVSVAGVNIDPTFQGDEVTLRAETGAWTIDGHYEPTLLVEAPAWYSGRDRCPEEPSQDTEWESETEFGMSAADPASDIDTGLTLKWNDTGDDPGGDGGDSTTTDGAEMDDFDTGGAGAPTYSSRDEIPIPKHIRDALADHDDRQRPDDLPDFPSLDDLDKIAGVPVVTPDDDHLTEATREATEAYAERKERTIRGAIRAGYDGIDFNTDRQHAVAFDAVPWRGDPPNGANGVWTERYSWENVDADALAALCRGEIPTDHAKRAAGYTCPECDRDDLPTHGAYLSHLRADHGIPPARAPTPDGGGV